MRILLIIWIAVMVYWQYFIINFLFQEANFSPHQWRQLLELALVLFFLIIWISDCLCLAHIATRNQDEFTVSFSSRRKFIFLFFEEVVLIWSLCNSLDHLECSHGVLAVFYNNIFISGSKLLSPSMKAVIRTYACAISLDHLDFWLFMFGSHSYSKSG